MIKKLLFILKFVKIYLLKFYRNFRIFIEEFDFEYFRYRVKMSFKFPYTLYKMLFIHFINWYILAQVFGLLVMIVTDLFGRLDTYMNNKVSILQILYLTLLFVPKSIWFTMPFVIMFGVIMGISTLYQSNELIAIFTSGISYFRFTLPILIFGIILAVSMIFFDSAVVVHSLRLRDNLFNKITNSESSDHDNITIKGEKDGYFWHANSFDQKNNTLSEVIVFEINKNFQTIYLIKADTASYTRSGWIMNNGYIRKWDQNGQLIEETKFYRELFDFTEQPGDFINTGYDIEAMSIKEAKKRIRHMKKLNIEHRKELTDYYKKFSFPLVLIIFSIFAIGVSTISKVYILLIALALSILMAIAYYIGQFLIFDNLASTGILNPLLGAWLMFIIFLPLSIVLLFRAKT